MPLGVRDEEVETNATNGHAVARPQRQCITRTTDTERKKKEASLVTAIRVMKLDQDPNNVELHEALLQQMLHILDKEHNDFIMKGRVRKALKGQRTRRQLPPIPDQIPDRGPQHEFSAFRHMEEEMNDGLTSKSEYASMKAGTTAYRMARDPALQNKHNGQQGMQELREKETNKEENCERNRSQEALRSIIKHVPIITSDGDMTNPENRTSTNERQGRTEISARKIITRTATAATERKKEETTLTTAIHIMELNRDPV